MQASVLALQGDIEIDIRRKSARTFGRGVKIKRWRGKMGGE